MAANGSDPGGPTTAMVLAAGLGTRMRPLTDIRPKPLVEVAGRPLIDHVLDRLVEAGVARAVVNVHYKADILEAYLKERSRPKIAISDERGELLDTGGGIAKALPLIGPDPFFIANTDALWIDGARPMLSRLARGWRPNAMDALLALAPTVLSTGYDGRGDFLLDPDGRLRRRPEHTIAPFVYTGWGILAPALFEGAPTGAFSLNRLFNRAIEAGRLFGLRVDGLWMHVGTPAAIEEAERTIADSVP